MWHLLTEVANETTTTGFLTELLNNTWTWVTTVGAGVITGVVAIIRSFVPSNSALLTLNDKIAQLKEMTNLDNIKIKELEEAQKAYQETNDELLKEIAIHSPNAKIKELGKQLEEKKKALSIQEQIQTKINEKSKELQAKVVSVLKKAETIIKE
jgi:exonuclease VII large subunit